MYIKILSKAFLVIAIVLSSFQMVYADNSHSVSLDASNDQHLKITDAAQTGLDLSGNFTIELWARFPSLPSSGDVYVIVQKHHPSTGNRGYTFDLHNSGSNYQLRSTVSDNGTNAVSGVVNWEPALDTWYHLAVVYTTSGNMKFYVNGAQQGSTQTGLPSSVYNNSQDFMIGSYPGASVYFFDGNLDDVRVWSTDKSSSEIANNRFSELTGSETNLVGYWQLNGTSTDATSNGNDLTLVNSPGYTMDTPASISCSIDDFSGTETGSLIDTILYLMSRL